MKLIKGNYYLIDIKKAKPRNPSKSRYLVAKCIAKDNGFEFIEYIDGHSCNYGGINGKRGHCWWVHKGYIIRKLTNDETMVELL